MRIIQLLPIAIFAIFILQAQDEMCIFTYGDYCAPIDEFIYIYEKNNKDEEDFLKKESIDEYLELYQVFKMKVKEAELAGMDTTHKFIRELDGYRDQLAETYLIDRDASNELIQEAHARSLQDVNVSHILLGVKEDATPEDTLLVYQKILKLKEQILNQEISFVEAAKTYSEDPSVEKNDGNIGFIRVFQTVYPFESAAYKLETGEISDPVRTQYGFHLINMEDKRAAKGDIQAAHILFKKSQYTDIKKEKALKEKAFKVYDELMEDLQFEEATKLYSNDVNNKNKGGDLGWFSIGKMVKSFETAAFGLDTIGQISKPIETMYGWHIIKLVDKKEIGTLSDMRHELKRKVGKDARSKIALHDFIERLEEEYNFKQIYPGMDRFIAEVNNKVLKGSWRFNPTTDLSYALYMINEEAYPAKDFAQFVSKYQRKYKSLSKANLLREMFEDFTTKRLLLYEKANLERKYPDFKRLMNEYHDGILLFELTNKKVWNKAETDSAGVADYFNSNRKQYIWEERADAMMIRFKGNLKCKEISSVVADIEDLEDLEEVKKQLRLLGLNNDLELSRELYEPAANEFVDGVKWKKGKSKVFETTSDERVFIMVYGIVAPKQKELDECKGYVLSDYQAALEKQWVDELKRKYPVTENTEVIEKLIQE